MPAEPTHGDTNAQPRARSCTQEEAPGGPSGAAAPRMAASPEAACWGASPVALQPLPAAQLPEHLLGAGAPRRPPAQHGAEAAHCTAPPRLPPSHLPSVRESDTTVQREDEAPRCLQGLMKHRHLGAEISHSLRDPTDCPQRQCCPRDRS